MLNGGVNRRGYGARFFGFYLADLARQDNVYQTISVLGKHLSAASKI